MVGDLLDMTRLRGGALRLRREPADIQDLIGASLTQLSDLLGTRPVEIEVAPKLPFVSLDFALVNRVLVNLLENALKYSPPESPITIRARAVGSHLEIQVADRGPGIPGADVARMFEKFQRGGRSADGGAGLGLAICKGFVTAHGGEIRAENRPGGGLIVSFTIPIDDRHPEGAMRAADERAGPESTDH
jgi:two-component system sensor histidine kinase KdpD